MPGFTALTKDGSNGRTLTKEECEAFLNTPANGITLIKLINLLATNRPTVVFSDFWPS